MSWMKRPRGSPASASGPGQNIYNPTQPPLPPGGQPLQQPAQWPGQPPVQQALPTVPPAANYQQQQQYWQQQQAPQPAQNAYNNQAFQQPNHPPQNAYPNEYYQYDQPQYSAQQPFNAQQNYQAYPNQQFNQNKPPQQNFQQNSTQEWDTANADPWDWGWQDDPANNTQANANQHRTNPVQQQQVIPNQTMNTNQVQQSSNFQRAPSNPPSNANILADSFANSGDSWNWSIEEQTRPEINPKEQTPIRHSREPSHDISHRQNVQNQSVPSPKPSSTQNYPPVDSSFVQNDKKNISIPHDDNKNLNLDNGIGNQNVPVAEHNVKTLNDREAVLEHMPNLGMGRRFHNETLTPQWSIESQPSQDSSDGLLSQTESTNRSEEPSRSSNKSSPGFNSNDNTNFNYAHPENTNDHAWDGHSYVENVQPTVNNVSAEPIPDNSVNQELIDSVRTLNINRSSVSPDKSLRNVGEQGNVLNNSTDANVLPPQVATPPLGRAQGNVPLPPTNKKPPQLPPSAPAFPPAGASNQNPFKRAGQLSHRNANRGAQPQMLQAQDNVPLPQPEPYPLQSSPFSQQEQIPQNIKQPSPNLINPQNIPSSSPRTIQQVNYSTANLETTPDNSERPDIPPPVNYRPIQHPHPPNVHQNAVENFEVAPSNDRNEYLQTGHLSDANYDNTNFADEDLSRNISQENYPPPGLRRMVLGQPESEFSQNSSFISDEPPPGLSRMVPGQLTDPNNIYMQSSDDYLDRQIDGQTTESESLNSSAYLNRTPTVYRQVDGQPTDDESSYNQNSTSRSSSDRRPVGLDRMVPGESSNFIGQSFQSPNFSSASDERVVTGFEQNNATEPREQNMDGSDYSEMDANQIRSIVGAVEPVDNRNTIPENPTVAHNVPLEPELNQRDLDMEGENLQDLSTISSADFSLVRDQNMDGADVQDEPTNRNMGVLDSSSERQVNQKIPSTSRDQPHPEKDRKYRDDTTGDESERDRLYKKNRKEKDRLRSSKERDSRYVDKRDDRRSEKDRRGDIPRIDRERGDERDRSYRKNRDARYETEDTDYYSDRDRRHYREGSYTTAKPPRGDTARREDERRSYDRSTRDDRDRRRRGGDERDSRYDSYESERDGNLRRREKDRGYDERDEDRDRRYGRDERNYASLKKIRSSRDERKRDPRYLPRSDSRDPEPTEDELNESAISLERDPRRVRRSLERDRDRDGDRSRQQRHRRDRDRGYNQQYYDRYGYSMDPYSQQMYQQHQTYQYYEKLRQTNPQAYLEFYNKYMAGQSPGQQDATRTMAAYGDAYSSLPGYDQVSSNRLGDERASVHSGRSSANGEALKDREFDTDASLNIGLENSTVKSERLTPVKFATAHIKGIISSPNLVTVNPSYPVDGQPAIVEILDLNKILANDPVRCELTAYPGPLIKGITHKKTVIEYCESKIREALERPYHDRSGTSLPYNLQHQHGNNTSLSEKQTTSLSSLPNNADLGSYVLMWELLILLLRQNGMVVGTDIAELLVKNKRQFEWRCASAPPTAAKNLSRRGSNSSVTSRSAEMPTEEVMPSISTEDNTIANEAEESSNDASLSARRTDPRVHSSSTTAVRNNARRTSSNTNILECSSQEKYVTDRFREYLLFGSGKEALEWAMTHGLWGHALFLASKMDKRTYANVMMRFANGLAANDPLQTLYQLMSGRQPASVTCILDEKWGDWRPHLAMILSNTTQRPDLDRKSITTLGDTLLARGDVYAAHFCYLMSREEFHSGPGAKLQLLGLAPPLPCPYKAPSHNIIMTEIYEYACALNQQQFVLGHFQFYKYLLATRLVDCGLYERALFYMESIAAVVLQSPEHYQISFLQRVLDMAERLKHYDPEENVGELGEDPEQSPYSQLDGSASQSGCGEKAWLTNLRGILHHLQSTAIVHEPQPPQSQIPHEYNQQLPNQQLQHQQYQQNPEWNQNYQRQSSNYDQLQIQQQVQLHTDQQQQQSFSEQQQQIDTNKEQTTEHDVYPQMYDPNAIQTNQSYLTPLSYTQQPDKASQNERDFDYGGPVSSSDSGYWNQDQQQNFGYNEDRDAVESLEPPRPQISMPNSNQGRGKSPYDDDPGFQNRSPSHQASNAQSEKQKEKKEAAAPSATKNQATSGWFGGIFNKLSLKPKNQMILPDDKNPSIVWDSDKKRWVNLDSDEQEKETHLAPPPKMADIIRPLSNSVALPPGNMKPPTPPTFSAHPAEPNQAPSPPMPNIFKLQKGRHIKKSYVDVFNPSGAPTRPLPPASEVLGVPLAQSTAPTTYFVPGAVPNHSEQQGAPTFYNPADY